MILINNHIISKYSSVKLFPSQNCNKSTFGTGERFKNAHSYFKNNPILKGSLKNYRPSRNIDHINSIENNHYLKKSKSVIFLRKNKKLEINTNNDILITRNTNHNLSKINNKSSNCITPGSFNPFINYKLKEKKHKYISRNEKNKDHFFHMNPTEIYTYRPILKRIYNCHSFARDENKNKTGKKMFNLKNVESKENQWDNNNKCKKRRFDYLCNTSNNFCNKNKKMYIFDGPTITSRDIYTKN